MIITGCEDGTMNVPNWRENLRFAGAFQNAIEEKYPQLTRPIFFCYRKKKRTRKMPNLQNVKYFMISFFITLLLFCFTGLFCYISIRGPEQPVFSYAQQDSLHGHAEFLGSGIPLDFTALEAWEQIRRT